jgi:allantoate deiminase
VSETLRGASIRRRIDELAAITQGPPGLTRMVWTPEHRRANDLVGDWMRAAGLAVREDAVGNVIGRVEGAGGEGRSLLVGSHLDTVQDAGSWDGPLGVVTAIAAIHALRAAGWAPRGPVEVIGFCDEEGTRFGAAMLGSLAVAGHFDTSALALRDADGITMEQAMRRFGLDPARIPEAVIPNPRAYLELHIEQGPVLERLDLPLGCVTAIAGATRLAVTATGEAGHAGTVPMPGRRDALAAAAAAILAVEEAARAERGAVATP